MIDLHILKLRGRLDEGSNDATYLAHFSEQKLKN